MPDSKLQKAFDALETADSAIKLAKQMLQEFAGEPLTSDGKSYVEKAGAIKPSTTEGRIIEGVFDGQNMMDKGGNNYPVPANYASKSKLIPGDVLKLTITEEGKFLYKQIGPVERKTIVGPLVYNEGQYQVLGNGRAYNVLLASVTYFRASVGDEVTLIIPMSDEKAVWGAIEAVIPKFDEPSAAPAKTSRKKKEVNLDDLDI